MILRPFLYAETACASYLFGCLSERKLAVVDPHEALVDAYLDEAERAGAPIVAVLETHVQADHVSGLPALLEATGATAYLPAQAGVEFEHEDLADGAEVAAAERAVATAMAPYERQIRELRARAAEVATETRRRERGQRHAARVSVRERAGCKVRQRLGGAEGDDEGEHRGMRGEMEVVLADQRQHAPLEPDHCPNERVEPDEQAELRSVRAQPEPDAAHARAAAIPARFALTIAA